MCLVSRVLAKAMMARRAVVVFAVAVVLALAAGMVTAAPTSDGEGVQVAALHHEEFELAGVLHRGVNFPDVFKFLDVSELRAQGRLASIESMPIRIAVGVRTDPTAKRFAPALLPDPTDKDTILELAKMSYNAYENYNDTDDWFDLPGYDPVRWMGQKGAAVADVLTFVRSHSTLAGTVMACAATCTPTRTAPSPSW